MQRVRMCGDVPLRVKKVKFKLEQAMKAQRRSRGVVLLVL
jgi:hypothetical protein